MCWWYMEINKLRSEKLSIRTISWSFHSISRVYHAIQAMYAGIDTNPTFFIEAQKVFFR